MNIEQLKLSNDLDTLFIDSKGSTAASVQIWFRAGSALENNENNGIAHFLEHMFFKGTETRPGSLIAHEIESFGGEVNAFTSFDYTCYYINCPNNHIKDSLNILLDMVSNPTFKEEELIPERDVVFEEYRRSIDSSSDYNFQQIQKTSFPKGYNTPILGEEATIKSFSREQVLEFRKNNYNTSNALLVVSGDIQNRKELQDLICEYNMPKGAATSFPKFKLKNKSTINVHNKDVRQGILTFAIQAPEYSASNVASEDLAINCLCHGETSKLYKELVTDKKIANGLTGSTMYFSKGGVHFLRVSFPTKNFSEVLKTIEKILKDHKKNVFTDSDVDKIKNQYIASKIYEKESLEAFSFSLGHGFAQDGNIHTESEFIDKIKKCNTKNVNFGLNHIFARPLHLTLQLPRGLKVAAFKKELATFQKDISSHFKKLSIGKRSASKITSSKYDPEAKIIGLKEGIKLIYRPNTMTPTFVLHAYFKGGLSQETKTNNGIHYLLGRSLTYGNKKTKYIALKNELEHFSSNLNGFSGKNAFGMTMHGLSDHKTKLFDHFFDTLTTPLFPAQYINLEKKLIRQIIENQKEDPIKQCFQSFNKLIFNDHNYSLELVGNNKTLSKHTSKSIQALYQKSLKKSPMVITYCGDAEMDEVIDMINERIISLKPRKFYKTELKKPKSVLGKSIKIPFDREQSQIFIGTKAYGISQKQDSYLKMVTAHLSGQSSDLFVEVRDRQGLCYAVQPVHHAALECGYWGIYIGAGADKTEKAIAAIKNIFENLSHNGISKDEFERIKIMLDGQNLLNIQTNNDYANIYSIPTLHELGIDFTHKQNEQIRNLKYEDFDKFTKKFFKQKWNVIEVGP